MIDLNNIADNHYSFSSEQDLLTQLSLIDIAVKEGSSKDKFKKELRVMLIALSTFVKNKTIEYPCHLEKSERPDFVLSASDRDTGFEITEACNSELKEATSVRAKTEKQGYPDAGYFARNAGYSKQKKREITLTDEYNSMPFIGLEPEENESDYLWESIIKKSNVITKSGFNKYSVNSLIVYLNTGVPSPNIDTVAELTQLKITDSEYWNSSHFDNIYALSASEEKLIHFDPSGFSITETNFIWP